MFDLNNPAQPQSEAVLRNFHEYFAAGTRRQRKTEFQHLKKTMKSPIPLIIDERGLLNNTSLRTLEDQMPTTTAHGAKQEKRVLTVLRNKHVPEMTERGVDDAFMLDYDQKDEDLSAAKTAVLDFHADKEQLTRDEHAAQQVVYDRITVLKNGAKAAFPPQSPQLKEFHIGVDFEHSTPKLIRTAEDLINAGKKYKDALASKGAVIGRDVDDLAAAVKALEAIDTLQEDAKRTVSPEATKKAKATLDALIAKSDFILAAAAAAFKDRPEILKPYLDAKNLRYLPTPKNPGDDPTPPPTPPTN